MAELFTMQNYQTLTHRGKVDPLRNQLLAWFNVDGKTNNDENKFMLLDHVNHNNFFTNKNEHSWNQNPFSEFNGKTYMQYPSEERMVISKEIGNHKITRLSVKFILNKLSDVVESIVTTQVISDHGGITIWLADNNQVRVDTSFFDSQGVAQHKSFNAGPIIKIGAEWQVDVRIDETEKMIHANVNGVDYSDSYNPAWTIPITQKDLTIGATQVNATYPVADFKIHEAKVYGQ